MTALVFIALNALLTWTSVVPADSYRVYADGAERPATPILAGDGLVRGLVLDVPLGARFTVTAVNAAGESPRSNAIVLAQACPEGPPTPTPAPQWTCPPTYTPTPLPPPTRTFTPTGTFTPEPTETETLMPTATRTATLTATMTLAATLTATPSPTATMVPTFTPTPAVQGTPTRTLTPFPTGVRTPVQLGSIPAVGCSQTGGFAFSGGAGFLASTTAGVAVCDITAPLNPRYTEFSNPPFFATRVAASGSRVVAVGIDAQNNAHLWVLSVTDPTRPPVLLGELATTIQDSGVSGFKDVTVYANGTRALLSMGVAGVQIVDVTQSPPVLLGSYDTPGQARACVVNAAGFAFCADFTQGLRVINLSNDQPAPWGNLALSGSQVDIGMTADERTVLLGSSAGSLSVVNVTDPAHPVSPATTVAVSGGALRVACEGNTCAALSSPSNAVTNCPIIPCLMYDFYDLTAPTSPRRLASNVALGLPGAGVAVEMRNGVVWIANGNQWALRAYQP